MPTAVDNKSVDPFHRRLYLPSYRISDAARYANTAPQTVSRWHYGGGHLGPALPGSQRRRPLSYMELIEVAFVAFFRKAGTSLQRIRRAREYVAQNLNSEYPFVEYRWWTEGFHLLMDLDQFEHTDDFAKVVVADAGGQVAWARMMADKFAEFDYERLGDENWALRWHPAGRQSKVVIDPRISFGAPMVEGLPTWVIRGRWRAREEIEEIMEDFDVSREAIIHALRFEDIDIAA